MISSDLAQHVAWLQEFAALGFDDIAIHHVGQDLDPFIDAFGEHVLPELRMSVKATSDLWWKDAVVYCLDVEMFYDSDGDGCGDLRRADRAGRLPRGPRRELLWLMPFYPSPNRDDGYDITDFYAVDPALGTLGDFAELVRTCRDRGIRVIADFVMNHTSDQHPWFQAARSSPDSPYRDFYVWSDERPEEKPGAVVFPDQETSTWAFDRKAGQYYQHSFYRHQPDLNLSNPEVRDELAQVMGVLARSRGCPGSAWTPCRS